MGIIIIMVLLGTIAFGLGILLSKDKINSVAFCTLSMVILVLSITLIIVLPIVNYDENRGNEDVDIQRYEEAQRLTRVITDDFITACEIKQKVDRVNERLEIAKKYNQRNEFMFGIFKEKTFAQYDYIEYNWEK